MTYYSDRHNHDELHLIQAHLHRIEGMLLAVLRKENLIMADQAALDAAITSLTTAVDAIVAKLNEVPDVDFTAEITQLTAATDEINAALAPPEPTA